MANLLLSVMGAFAQFERALIGERQREGIALAKRRGAYWGARKRWGTIFSALKGAMPQTVRMVGKAARRRPAFFQAFNADRG